MLLMEVLMTFVENFYILYVEEYHQRTKEQVNPRVIRINQRKSRILNNLATHTSF